MNLESRLCDDMTCREGMFVRDLKSGCFVIKLAHTHDH
jgi:hypothetical protein